MLKETSFSKKRAAWTERQLPFGFHPLPDFARAAITTFLAVNLLRTG
jgi:hypothetical protein